MTDIRSTTFELMAPEVSGQTVRFSWSVDPRSDLYRRESCTLTLPDGLDPHAVPDRLWWTAQMMLLAPHWALLAPSVVRVPIELEPGEAAVWGRLADSFSTTLWALRSDTPPDPGTRIETGTLRLPPVVPRTPASHPSAAAFSAGKDSMVQASMLSEIGLDPVLVAVTSPMPDRHDHGTVHRRHAFEEYPARRGNPLFEVQSDYRTAWDNDAAARLGFPIAINEISDTFLYTAAIAVVGHLVGARYLFLASESEVSTVTPGDAGLLQHRHFMYSAITQGVLSRLLEPLGMRLGSATVALRSDHVQRLLTTRYDDVADLQFSCWRATDERRSCSECSECKRLTWVAMAAGGRPADLGIDLPLLLTGSGDLIPPTRHHPHRPDAAANEVFAAQIRTALASIPVRRVIGAAMARDPWFLLRPRGWRGIRRFIGARAVARRDLDPRPGVVLPNLRFLDPEVRTGVAGILASAFPAVVEDPESTVAAAAILGEIERIAPPPAPGTVP